MKSLHYTIIGTVGLPANYGGFETLAENLARYHANLKENDVLVVYCEAAAYPIRATRFLRTDLHYVPLKANGPQSIAYDVWSMIHAALRGTNAILVLGVSGALALPLVRIFSGARIITNIDGIEWRREKWSGLAKWVLRASEWAAVKWSHIIVADNPAIATYVMDTYHRPCEVIAYGGDHALATEPCQEPVLEGVPDQYALALCRIEPENNAEMILEAFTHMPEQPLVFIGNWDNSVYARELRKRYGHTLNLYLFDPVYDAKCLRSIRNQAWVYVHGHSAGGTNPSLVEMMHFAIPVIAYDCEFNRQSTEHAARYFQSALELEENVRQLDTHAAHAIGQSMIKIARKRYTWNEIGRAYFDLLARK